MHSITMLTVILVTFTVLQSPFASGSSVPCTAVCDETSGTCEGPAVCQSCGNINVCPECFNSAGEATFGIEPCCRVYADLVAITAASAQASAFAFAAAFSSASAASAVIIYTAAATSVGAYVSLSESVSFSINDDFCCRVSAEISAEASSSAQAFAEAAAESRAYAEASASAFAFANASAAAAAALVAQAQFVIESSCCGFNAELIDSLDLIASYSSYASIAAGAAAQVSQSASAVAFAVTNASAEAQTSANAMASGEINHCCGESEIFASARATADACAHACSVASASAEVIEQALDEMQNFDFSEDISQLPFADASFLCASECSDVGITCCSVDSATPCCENNNQTVCLASTLIVDVLNSAEAIVAAFTSAVAEARAEVNVFAHAISLAEVASHSAASVSLSIIARNDSCKDARIIVDRTSMSQASAVATALANAAAVAEAFALGESSALALSAAVGNATASANALILGFNSNCCGTACCDQIQFFAQTNSLSCCDILFDFVESFSNAVAVAEAEASANSNSTASSFSTAELQAASHSCTNLIRRSTSRSFRFFTLDPSCRCCETPSTGGSSGSDLLASLMG